MLEYRTAPQLDPAGEAASSDLVIVWQPATGKLVRMTIAQLAQQVTAAPYDYIDNIAGDLSGRLVSEDGEIETPFDDAYAVDSRRNPSVMTDGFSLVFRAHRDNTGSTTLDIEGTGPYEVHKRAGAPLVAGDIEEGAIYHVTFVAADQAFRLVAQVGMVPRGAWQSGRQYSRDEVVSHNGSSFFALSHHTAGSTTEPGIGGSWETVWGVIAEKGATGAAGPAFIDFLDRAAVGLSTIPDDSTIELIRTLGYASPGDGGGWSYLRAVSEPGHTLKVQSDDGAWWGAAPGIVPLKVAGAAGDGSTPDTAAFAAAFDASDYVRLEPGIYRVDDDVDIVPAGKVLVIEPGAYIQRDATKTVGVKGTLVAQSYQIFTGDGVTSFAGGVMSALNGAWWGVDPSGDNSSTDAINEWAAALREIDQDGRNSFGYAGEGGVIKIDGDGIDFTGLTGQLSCVVDWRGARILGNTTGKNVFELIGSRHVTFRNGLCVGLAGTDRPQCGAVLGRYTNGNTADNITFDEFYFEGEYALTAICNYASEVFKCEGKWTRNQYAGGAVTQNGGFDSDTVWSKGAGWAIAGGVATKSAGTGANLSQSIGALVPGQRVKAKFTITAISAGSFQPRLTGGSVTSGSNRNAPGTYEEILVAQAGNNGISIWGDSSAAGSIDDVSFEVLDVFSLIITSHNKRLAPATVHAEMSVNSAQSCNNHTLSKTAVRNWTRHAVLLEGAVFGFYATPGSSINTVGVTGGQPVLIEPIANYAPRSIRLWHMEAASSGGTMKTMVLVRGDAEFIQDLTIDEMSTASEEGLIEFETNLQGIDGLTAFVGQRGTGGSPYWTKPFLLAAGVSTITVRGIDWRAVKTSESDGDLDFSNVFATGRVEVGDRANVIDSRDGGLQVTDRKGADTRIGPPRHVTLLDDFLLRPPTESEISMSIGAAPDSARWLRHRGSEASCVHFAGHSSGVGGVIRAVLGATGGGGFAAPSTTGASICGPQAFRVDRPNFVTFEALIGLTPITDVALFVGLTNTPPAGNGLADADMPFTLAAGNALTANLQNAVGFVFDTAADNDNWWLCGVMGGTPATHQNAGVAPSANSLPNHRLRIELRATGAGAVADFFIDGVRVGSQMTGAVAESTRLAPILIGFSRTSSTRAVTCDYIFAQSGRNA